VGFEYNLLIIQALVLPPNERGFQNKSISFVYSRVGAKKACWGNEIFIGS